jgi:hypothetical protein
MIAVSDSHDGTAALPPGRCEILAGSWPATPTLTLQFADTAGDEFGHDEMTLTPRPGTNVSRPAGADFDPPR